MILRLNVRTSLRGLLFVTVLLLARSADAQRAPAAAGYGVITGTVTDTSLRAIAGVDIQVIGTESRLTADANGRFSILQVPPGEFLVWVRKFGYRPISNLVHVEQGDTLRLAFTLEPTMTELNTVTVTEKARSPRMRDFDERRKAGFGEFLDQAQIEKLNFASMDAVIHTFKAVSFRSGATAVSSRSPIPNCVMEVYIDGIPRGARLTDLPTPKEIAGVEVYAGPASTPLWLPQGGRNSLGPPSTKSCGVILIWTRDGS